jgi:hypothetical protein
MCPALTLTMSGSQRKSLTNCLPELTDDDRMDHMLDCSARWRSLCPLRISSALVGLRRLLPQIGGAIIASPEC